MLQKHFRDIVTTYIQRLCKQLDTPFEYAGIDIDDHGAMVYFESENWHLVLSDITFLVDYAIGRKEFEEWWDYNYAQYRQDKPMCNLVSWFLRNYRDIAIAEQNNPQKKQV